VSTYLVTLDTLTAIILDSEQYYDASGTSWICTKLEGWWRAPARDTQHTRYPTADGAQRSAAYRGTRNLVLEGRYFPPTVEIGFDLADRVVALCPDPGERYPLLVQDYNRNLVAYVEQAGEILCDKTGPLMWDWSIPLVAADPYRYSAAWTQVGPTLAGDDSVGGIDFSGSGSTFTTPGLDMGTAATRAAATVAGVGTADNQLVLAVTGQTTDVQIPDIAGTSIVGIRGQVPAGETMFINCSARTAFDVPGCPTPIPGYGAVLGGASARGSIWISGGWPVLRPGERRTFQLNGTAAPSAALTVYARGTWA